MVVCCPFLGSGISLKLSIQTYWLNYINFQKVIIITFNISSATKFNTEKNYTIVLFYAPHVHSPMKVTVQMSGGTKMFFPLCNKHGWVMSTLKKKQVNSNVVIACTLY